jgi:hypothetical protein
VWLAREVQQVATARGIAHANGIASAHIISLPSWHRGPS